MIYRYGSLKKINATKTFFNNSLKNLDYESVLIKNKGILLCGHFRFLYDPFRLFLNLSDIRDTSIDIFIVHKDLKIKNKNLDTEHYVADYASIVTSISGVQKWQIKRFLV